MIIYKSIAHKVFLAKERNSFFQKVKILSSLDASKFSRANFYDEPTDDIELFESFFIILLNNANNTIGSAKISQGGTTATVVDLKIIAKFAVDSLASSVILIHNHPSGNLEPSKQDKELTHKIKNGLSFLDIKLLDHVILTFESHFSFADDGLI